MRLKSLFVSILLTTCGLTVSCVSVKPIYNSDEQLIAETAVADFFRLYNEQDFDGIFKLFDAGAQLEINRADAIANMRNGFEQTGKISNPRLSQAKVFPGSPIQVRMIYNVEAETGEPFQIWFIWANRDDKARLLQIDTWPGHDDGATN